MPITPLPLAAGPDVLSALPTLERALTGTAPVRPHAPDETPTTPEGEVPDDLAAAVTTSGSTGRPKLTLLTATALLASAEATARRLGGHGQWLLALPPQHVAGLQVLLRSITAGTTPVVVDEAGGSPLRGSGRGALAPPTRNVGPKDTAFAMVRATAAMTGERRYTSLVPTQLARLVEDPMGLEALRRFDAILVGGAATPPHLIDRARSLGARVVTTYGMSETCGGCVYNGRPLEDVRVREGEGGRLEIGGPVLAAGYLGDPGGESPFVTDSDGSRWYRTSDLGRVDGEGRVTVLGRADDLINTGGLKVAPRIVEEAAVAHVPAVTDAVVVGVPDPRWGQAVSLAAVTSPGGPPPGEVPEAGVAEIREMLRAHLPAHALPQKVHVVTELPRLGPGKPDRSAVAGLFTE